MRRLSTVIVALGLCGCPDFASDECTVRALCASADGAAPIDVTVGDTAISDVTIDVPISDTNSFDVVVPADGNCCVVTPSGWSGPVALWQGTSGAPNCAGVYAGASTDYNDGLSASPATCTTCSCGGVSGQACIATIQMYNAGACTSGTCGSPITVSSGCTSYGPCGSDGASQSMSSTAAVSAGTCTPFGGAPTVPSVAWSTAARTCAYSGTTTTCVGGTCYEPPPSPFVGPCVTQAGIVASCPSAFPNRGLYYGGVTDTRGCTACACAASTGGSCNNYIQFWHGSTCTDFPITSGMLPNEACADTYTTSYVGGSVKGGLTVVGGSCAFSGGAPQGTATEASPITICCQ